MYETLARIRAALAAMTDAELNALRRVAVSAPAGLALGVLAFVASTCDWEIHRRSGQDSRLDGPHEMIHPDDLGISLTTLAALVVGFADCSPRVRGLLRAI